MTYFLCRSQRAPREFLKGSRGFRKRRGLRRSRSQPSLDRPALTHKIVVTAYLASTDDSSRVNVSHIVGLPLQHRRFRPFQHFRANRRSANPLFFITYVCHDVWHGSCLGERCDASNQLEVVMWKITTRGFTLEEVLIMAAMNLPVNAAPPPKREKPASKLIQS